MLTQAHSRGSPWTNMLARLEDERIMLQRIAAGEPLSEVLEHVLRAVEAQSSVPLRASILFVDEENRLRTGAAPSLPADYLAAVDGTPIGPHVASWGQAAYSGEPVYVDDIATHPNWSAWREQALRLGIRTCWSSPIKRPNGRLLGVFSNYYEQRRMPSAHDIEAIALVTRTAALAIERHRIEGALRQSAQRWRSMFEGMQEGFFLAEAMRDELGHIRDFRLLEVNPAFEQQCGRRPGASLGRTLREVFGGAPRKILELFIRAMETGEPVQAEYCVPGPPQAWYEVRARREGPARLMAMQLDVSARKLAEKKLSEEQHHKSFQLALGDQLRLLELPDLIERAACEALGRHLALGEVYLLKADRESGAPRMISGWAPDGQPAAPSHTIQSVATKAVGRGRSMPLPQAAGDGLVVPLGRWGRPESVLVARSHRPRWLLPADRACIEEAAERLCDAAERAAHPLQLQERVEQAIAERDRIWRLSPEILAVMDRHGRFLSASPAVRAILGWTPEEFLSMGFSTLLHPEDRPATRATLAQAVAGTGGGMHHMENRVRKRGGGYGWINWTLSSAQGHLYLAGRDDTDLKAQAEALSEAETALRQAQKLEAVGRLTGGISHDFNNMLQGISGALYLMERRLAGGDLPAVRRYLGMASDACERAAQLTQRLLAFSRRQPIDPRPCDAGDTLRSMVELFRRYTGERVELQFDLQPGIWPVCCDVNQFENVVLNLVINACDAIADEGSITLQTRNVELDAACLRRFPQASPGEFVEIAITDTGCGMTPEVLAHTFEPFFTTKPVGVGTGLGLSTSYGFAQQAGGAVAIESTQGRGTTMRVWLPRYKGSRRIAVEGIAQAPKASGTAAHAVVFLAEDDGSVREMVIEAITGPDVTVLCACDGIEGARRLAEAGHVDLLITDIGLPGMDGRELAAQARRERPGLPVLFMTGYAEDLARDPPFLGRRMELIVKPFALDAFTARVRAMLSLQAQEGGMRRSA